MNETDPRADRPPDVSGSAGTREAAVRDHLANERTLLAWQRTALGVIAIGFLVDRFALEGREPTVVESLAGVALVLLGAVVSLVGTYRYVRTEREIETDSFRPGILAHLALTAAIVLASAVLLVLLLGSFD